MAESAVRAGYSVAAIDGYADLDLAAIAQAKRLAPYSAQAAAAAGRTIPCDAICYVSNIENHPGALRQLIAGRPLWGNSAATLVRVRDPVKLADALANAHVNVARLRARAPHAATAAAGVGWLIKPRASGGGHGIRVWEPGQLVSRQHVLQERIAGSPASILFVADGRACIPFGLTRQLIGERRLGAAPFRYCGNILPPSDDPRWGLSSSLWWSAGELACVVTRAFGLVGVCGIDFMVRRGRPVPLEVNPRYTAAMELAERRDRLSVFSAHVAGCTNRLAELSIPSSRPGASGKALVFARRSVTVGDTRQWLRNPDIRDVPSSGSRIGRGSPICTVFATADTTDECHAALLRRAADIHTAVERMGG
jgi:uncharacterized protein